MRGVYSAKYLELCTLIFLGKGDLLMFGHAYTRTLLGLFLVLMFAACQGLSIPSTIPVSVEQGSDVSAISLNQKLSLCTSSASATQMNVQFATAEQIFEKYSLDVDLIEIDGGSTAAAALIAGDVQICQIAGSAVVNAAVAGADLVFIGGVINRQPYYLITRPEIVIPTDLVGQSLAATTPGSSSYTALVSAIEWFGLVPEQQVTILSIGGQSERLAALASGHVAGTVLSPPQAMLAIADGYNLMLDYAEMEQPYQHTAIITTRSLLQQQPDLVKAYLQAVSEAVATMHTDRARTVAVMAEHLQLDPVENATALDLTYDLIIQGQMSIPPYPSLPGIQALIDELVQEVADAANFTPDDMVDLTILEQLEAEGFFAELAR
jgi:NitT/TauT family transport system substrate-binding protein